jgi:hypothetical protein
LDWGLSTLEVAMQREGVSLAVYQKACTAVAAFEGHVEHADALRGIGGRGSNDLLHKVAIVT